MLRRLPPSTDPNLLAGRNPADDAAVYRLSSDLALIQSVDFFTPVVDDPYDFGRIAAANSLSDIYAMGGRPLTALNVAAFPMDTVDLDILAEILRGGADKAREAGVTVIGGHTVDDAEPKYGMAVTGTVEPGKFVTSSGARPGDLLVLTKPLGTGIIATALKAGAASRDDVNQAVRWMVTLNRSASHAMLSAGAHASSDITGFGLLGHLHPLLHASGVAARVSVTGVPLLPGAEGYARAGHVPGGSGKNLAAVEEYVHFPPGLDDVWHDLLVDPQTSGGLLMSLDPARLPDFQAHAASDMLSAVIGQITAGPAGHIDLLPR